LDPARPDCSILRQLPWAPGSSAHRCRPGWKARPGTMHRRWLVLRCHPPPFLLGRMARRRGRRHRVAAFLLAGPLALAPSHRHPARVAILFRSIRFYSCSIVFYCVLFLGGLCGLSHRRAPAPCPEPSMRSRLRNRFRSLRTAVGDGIGLSSARISPDRNVAPSPRTCRIRRCRSVRSWLTRCGGTYPLGINRTTNSLARSSNSGSGCPARTQSSTIFCVPRPQRSMRPRRYCTRRARVATLCGDIWFN